MNDPYSILIIDDDIELTEMLQDYLSHHGFDITVANHAPSGLKMALSTPSWDLILLDVMMPEMDGFEVLKELRKSQVTPVLMLTARGDDFDRIVGLELGADDYLPKPFNHRELVARIKAILRRYQLANQSSVQDTAPVTDIGGLVLDKKAQSATYCAKPLELTGTEFSILALLMHRLGTVVSKEDISQDVLGRRLMAFDRSIDMHVSNLRKKLGAINQQELIKTIRGSGYLFRDIR